jgi:hypothetical protein
MSEKQRPGSEIDRWPEDEAPASEAEQQAAERFRDALEATGDAPVAPDPEQVELHAAAAMLRSVAREEHLEPAERDRLVREAIGLARPVASPARSFRRFAGLALAASVLILLGSLLLVGRGQLSSPRSRIRPVPRLLTSRSSDELIGPIEDRAGAARRLDLVFADRLAGYRRGRLLASGGQP